MAITAKVRALDPLRLLVKRQLDSEGFILSQPPNISAIFNPTGRLNFTESTNIEDRKDKQSVSNGADEYTEIEEEAKVGAVSKKQTAWQSF